jgi:hypothetical protein
MHDFEQLCSWQSLSDEEVRRLCDEAMLSALRRCAVALGYEGPREGAITPDNFGPVARATYVLLREGSNALSNAIGNAGKYLKRGESEKAIALYQAFIQACPSPFYQEIAQGQIRTIEGME